MNYISPLPPPHGRERRTAVDTYPHYRAAILVRVAGCDHKLVARGSKLVLVYGYPDSCNQTMTHSSWTEKGPSNKLTVMAFDGHCPVITKRPNGLLKTLLIKISEQISLSARWSTHLSQTMWAFT